MLQGNDSSEPDPTRESSLDLSAPREALTEILRAGAQKMLAAAIEQEVASYVADRTGLLDEGGHRLVVRNGFLPEREIMTGVGNVAVKQPRVRDKRSCADSHGHPLMVLQSGGGLIDRSIQSRIELTTYHSFAWPLIGSHRYAESIQSLRPLAASPFQLISWHGIRHGISGIMCQSL